ncbi:TylF/MycF/NovP-related O-methyltransferase [Dictyobacter kobayashii]|uniref:Macrocin O-methyltransferase n=1 Tax=Dictyobacter kobayashii TaxID=2014872 RepID=A0A402AC77_9CHLR|nr:TylF/MycF/NovP-related O-methyltransferase [Dictyobacter kobayashii]GCE16696.1 hypothetical protein KDK_04960 [Dictyobacter kobayashii]
MKSLVYNGAPKYEDFSETDTDIVEKVYQYTLTTPERIFALIRAVEYVVTHDIPGDMVECGVWKGGSMMAIAYTLLRLGCTDRHLYLFDTFEGMPDPKTYASKYDLTYSGETASKVQEGRKSANPDDVWHYAPLNEVQALLSSVGYDTKKIHFIKGKVEETLPQQAPNKISILRLDTDWYSSTLHELVHLFPLLSQGGVLLLDDYGHWQGAKKATDEYFQEHHIPMLLNRIDYTGRIGIKYTKPNNS